MALKVKNTRSEADELNFIGVGTEVEGKIETKGSLRIDGKVQGTVRSGDTVTIGASGEVVGEIYARNGIVGGKIVGNIYIDEKLILESTSLLKGNLRAGKLVIDEGARFHGKSEMEIEGLEKMARPTTARKEETSVSEKDASLQPSG